ncbi:MAG: hypothetical protein K2K93_11575, partial [Muribaculaceae bacterium]|nr:hypothetical protein [Muribaculaceae bacterium]
MTLLSLLGLITEEGAHLPSVEMPLHADEGTYEIAGLIMKIVDWIFNTIGLHHHSTLELTAYSILVFAISWGIGYIAQLVILFVVDQVGKRWKGNIYSNLIQARFFHRIARIIPAIFFLIFIQFTMQQHSSLSYWLSRVTWIYLAFIFTRCLTILVNVIWNHVDARENKKKLPLKGLVQLVCGVLWILFGIVT